MQTGKNVITRVQGRFDLCTVYGPTYSTSKNIQGLLDTHSDHNHLLSCCLLTILITVNLNILSSMADMSVTNDMPPFHPSSASHSQQVFHYPVSDPFRPFRTGEDIANNSEGDNKIAFLDLMQYRRYMCQLREK